MSWWQSFLGRTPHTYTMHTDHYLIMWLSNSIASQAYGAVNSITQMHSTAVCVYVLLFLKGEAWGCTKA